MKIHLRPLLIYSLLIAAPVTFMTHCKKKDYPIAQQTPLEIDSIAAQYYKKYLELYPLEATSQGKREYNASLPIAISPEFISREVHFYDDFLRQLKTLNPEKLDRKHQLIYYTLDYTLKDKLQRLAFHPEEIPFTQFGGLPLDFPVLGSGEGIQPFDTEKDYENWLSRMQKFPQWTDIAIENFRKGMKSGNVLPRVLVHKMISQMRAEEINTTDLSRNIFWKPVGNMPGFSAEARRKITQAYRTAILIDIIPSYKKLGDFLENEYLPNSRITDGLYAVPKGRETYEYLVRSWTTTNLKPEEIYQTGLREVENLSAEMRKVQAELGYEGSLPEFLTALKTDKNAMPYKSSGEVLQAFRNIQKKIEPGLQTMFTKRPKTPFEIRQTEKFRENTASAEYIQGSPDGKRPGIFYIPLPHPENFNVASGMESLFLHEAIPGHHYQISLQQENTDLPDFMRFGWSNAYGEGWAHYTETLGPALGLYTDPYQKMGYLSDQMLRAVRLVIDTGIHTGKMTREEGIKYFTDHVAYDQASAIAEVERYMAIPGQALGYKIGSLKILELRKKASDRLGKKFSLAGFHDAVLESGCVPLSLLETRINQWIKDQEKKK